MVFACYCRYFISKAIVRVGTPIKQLKLMVTFVENACLLWAQILSPDIIDSLNQLRNDLQSVCF